MFMKHSFNGIKFLGNKFNRLAFKNFSVADKQAGSISLRFHDLYVKELQRIEKNS